MMPNLRAPLALLLMVAACSAPAADDSASEASHIESTSCSSSPLFAKIAARARGAAGAGFVPASLMVTQHNTASLDVLIGGQPIFNAVADLIASAEHEVELQTWRWDVNSDPSVRVLGGLKRLEARRRSAGATTPVVVRLLVNRVSPALTDTVTNIYRQIDAQALDPKLVDVQLVDFLASGLLGANHAKTVVVDGNRALVMGANVTSDYGKDPDMWDAGFPMTGEVAQAIHADFARMWSGGQLWRCGTAMEPQKTPDSPTNDCWQKPAPATASAVVDAPGTCTPMLVATHPQNGAPFPWSNNDNPQAQVFLGGVELAEKMVRIQSPNLNEGAIKTAIVAAARRGVTVQLILSKKFEETGESFPGRGGGNEATVAELYKTLSDLPNACETLQVHWYSKDGTQAVEGTRPPASHVKYMSIDGQVVVVGSSNQDVQSWRNSHEVNVATDSADVTRAWDTNLFGKAWARSIVVDECKR